MEIKEKELLERLARLEERLDKVEGKNDEEPESSKRAKDMKVGTLTYSGKYESTDGGTKATFGGDISIDKILKINSKDLAQVIDAFSSEDRIDIVKLLLKKALTAKEIMDILNFPTTGKVYHHLSFLEKLGIIKKDNEKYWISSRYISCVIFMMLGVSQILEKRS